MEMKRYQKEENFSPEKIAKLREHYKAILELLGEDPAREGLLKTPERVAKAMAFLTKGYDENPLDIIRSAMFREEYRQMVRLHPGSPQPDGRRRRDRSQPYVYADAGRRKAGFGHDYLGIHRSIPLAPAYAPGVHDADQQQIPVK